MNEPRYRKLLSAGLLAAAVGLLAVGATRSYVVYPDPEIKPALPPVSEPNFNEPSFAPQAVFIPPPPAPTEYSLGDLQLLENTTFTGVVRKAGQFQFTYDPTQKRGKRGCPT